MKIFLWSLVLFFVGVLAFAIFYPAHRPANVADANPQVLDAITVISYINVDREAAHLKPLAINEYLMNLAQSSAYHMAQAQDVASVNDQGISVKKSVDKSKYPYTDIDGLESRAATSTSTGGSKEYVDHFRNSGSPFIAEEEDIGVGVAYDINRIPYVSLIVGTTK